MAVTGKENVNPEIMLEDHKEILEELPPRPETARDKEVTTAGAARDLSDKLARDGVKLENEERRTRGRQVGHNIY